ncbi:MAG: MAPEG family protein [Pseudomonadales bacterium]|nr:MAPEG family protein [Pseudomonadales bacterium]MDP6471477.1 MAPEG family protein [Pseudomonadales bacterium]MDP6828646.1 MAPEG family protein [Pseudomonadales bacterium]MDP6972365.1 MAPEG family protein [Pseudomonadales bacterium]
MTTQLVCLLIGIFLPYLWAGVSVPFRMRQFGNMDYKHPRVQGEQLVDQGARVWGAQSNAWEALVVFGIANGAAYMTGVDPAGNWAIAAMVWIVARLGHGVFYIMGVSALRVLSFVTGMAMSIWILLMALWA